MSWTMLYAHDANGSQTAGNLGKLIEAVEHGLPIRFLSLEGDEIAAADAQWVYVRNRIVFGENTSNISDGFQGDRLVFNPDSFHWYVTVSTKGDRDMIRWKVGEHTPGGPGHTQDHVALRWFAEL